MGEGVRGMGWRSQARKGKKKKQAKTSKTILKNKTKTTHTLDISDFFLRAPHRAPAARQHEAAIVHCRNTTQSGNSREQEQQAPPLVLRETLNGVLQVHVHFVGS